MYRLLIVTKDPSAIDRLNATDGWEKLGFRPPRICQSFEEAKASLSAHRVDAIAVDADPDFDELHAYLDEHYPTKPLCRVEKDPQKQRQVVQELYSLLTRLSADDTNDEYDDAYKLQQQRERWLKKVIGGMVPTEEEMQRQICLYRCRERLDVPCVLARLEMPDDDTFLSERWHYGSERLEQALRNFFGFEHDHMLMHVAVVSQEEVRVLCYPASLDMGISENVAFEYVQETLEQVDHYLGLHMKVLEVRRIPGLLAFAAEHAATDA